MTDKVTEKLFLELRKLLPQIPEKDVVGLSISLSTYDVPVLTVQTHILEQDEVLAQCDVYFIDSTVEKNTETSKIPKKVIFENGFVTSVESSNGDILKTSDGITWSKE